MYRKKNETVNTPTECFRVLLRDYDGDLQVFGAFHKESRVPCNTFEIVDAGLKPLLNKIPKTVIFTIIKLFSHIYIYIYTYMIDHPP